MPAISRNLIELKLRIELGRADGDASLAFNLHRGGRIEGKKVKIPAGAKGTWEVIFTAGKEGIKRGGGIAVSKTGFLLGTRPQDFNPRGMDYITVETDGDATLRLVANTLDPQHRQPVARVIVKEGCLKEGDRVVLKIGDMKQGGLGSAAYPFVTQGIFMIGLDPRGDGIFKSLAVSPLLVEFIPDPPVRRYHFTGPSRVAPGENFSLNITALDLNGNLIEDHVGKVDIRSDSPVEGLPESVSFTEKDRGTVNLEGLKVRTPGIYRISLHDEKSSVVAEANPIQCLVSVRERIYWGDLHTHGYDANDPVFLGWLNRTNHPTSCHQYARDVARLDFCSLSPMNPPPESDVPELWKLYRRVVEEMNEPGRYVTFMGPEWHGLGGDRTIVSKDPNFTIPYPKMPIEELYAEYADNPNVLMIPHVGGGIADWDYFTPKEGEHLIEVASGHGNFEWILQDAASRGFKVGVTGSTDNLFGCPGRPRSVLIAMGRFFGLLNRRDSGYGSGPITAVLAKSLTREGIWEALRARKMYATTGARIILEFDVDGKPIGSIIKMETVPVLRGEVHGTAPIDRIDIIRNNSLLHSLKGGEKDVSFEIEDKSIPLGESYYYVRVSQIDGEYAWSTPIWVSNIGYAPQKAEVLPWNKDEDIDLVKLRPNEAEKFEEALKDYISRVEDPDCFDEVTPVKIVNAPEGKYALFYAYIKPERKRISIKWFYQFEMPRVRFETGWRDFGICEPI